MSSEPAPAAWRAAVARPVGRLAFALLYRCRTVGAANVPRRGPVVLVANHTGFLDGALVLALAPRPSHFLVLDRTFAGFLGRLLHWTGQIPLDQRTGDRRALGQALEVLARGGVVGIFPEGGRGRGDLENAGKGAAWLALRSGAAVVPVACLGTRATGALASSWPRLRSRLVVDAAPPVPLDVPAGLPGRAALELATERLRVAHAEHVRAAADRHGLPLPTDVPPDLLD
ncbi:lysophospholipid acyltransferase family protein [Phycicoccus sonneratiae]|uniref:1-acyl-sn-glycerol-3-phosphate acyltransferase n=1 Tax=Phycicoccus sonneratiae TaxID=2807628 RepID=A0ABS2CKM3_9MICO|nr:lysophospholipid acyltransferase family protein [Phycicoccus sonneraticus]MBM6399701.1 1-acyl-sn-glycerol-3-phosphate acyltransferase [Phycicoccus sonneraticus]